MLAAIEDKDVVVPVYADAADFLECPAGREFCPVLYWFVGVCAAANGSHARAPLFVAGRKLVTKQKVGPAQFRQQHLAAARTSKVFSTVCGWKHIFKTSRDAISKRSGFHLLIGTPSRVPSPRILVERRSKG